MSAKNKNWPNTKSVLALSFNIFHGSEYIGKINNLIIQKKRIWESESLLRVLGQARKESEGDCHEKGQKIMEKRKILEQ